MVVRHMTLPLRCVSTAFILLSLPGVSPLPSCLRQCLCLVCSTAFVTKILPLRCVFHCLSSLRQCLRLALHRCGRRGRKARTQYEGHCLSVALPLPSFSKTVSYLAVLIRLPGEGRRRRCASSLKHCLSVTFHCLPGTFHRLFLGLPLPSFELPLPLRRRRGQWRGECRRPTR